VKKNTIRTALKITV